MSDRTKVDPEPIPDELKDRDQWLLWDASNDTPRRPHWKGDFGISWSDPDDWHAFEEALAAAQSRASWGIGYVMAQDNDGHPRGLYGCLDLDGCLSGPESPKDWLPSLQKFIDDGAYVERSPSGDGLHIPLVGQEAPDWWTDSHFSDDEHEGVEWLTNKFCTFTGDLVGDQHDGVADTDPTQFFFDAYKELNGESPRVEPSDDARAHEGDMSLSETDVKEALACIDSDCTYPKWRDIGFAVHDWDSSATGKQIFESWSRGSGWDNQSQRYVDAIWENAEQGDGVTIATLIHHAKQAGWETPGSSSGADKPGPDTTTGGGNDTQEQADGNSAEDWTLDPISILQLAVNDHMHPADYDDDGNFDLYPRDLRTNERASYTWELAKKSGNDDVLARRHGPLLAYKSDTSTWENDDDQRLREIANEALGSAFSQGVVDEVEANIRADPDRVKDPEQLGAPDETIMTPAGLLHLRDRELEPGKREHLAVCNLPHEPDWDADCPRWEEFVQESIDTEHERKKFQEYCGYSLWRHAQTFGKAMLLVGPTDSGKSTALKVIRHVLGDDNVASESLQNLIDTRWGKAQLVGNIANIREEVTPSGLQSVEAFKELTGGEGKVTAEFKGQKKFDFVVKQKFMFATNEVPSVQDADEAFYNRLLFVRFPTSVDPDDQDPDLDDELKSEAPGILNWMLDGLDRLLEQNGFTAERSINGKKELCDAFGGVIDRFSHNCLMITGNDDDIVSKADLHDLAQRYAEDIDKEPGWSKQSGFTSEITNQRGIGQTQRRIEGDVTDVLSGVRVKPEIVYRYDMDIKARTVDTDESQATGLQNYQDDDVRPGYDSSEERNLPPLVVKTVRMHDDAKGVSHDDLVDELADEGVSESKAESAIETCLRRGDIHEPRTGYYRAT